MRKIIVLLLVALCVTVSPLAFTGCKSSPVRVTYNIEATSQTSVKLALRGWAGYVAQFHPPASQEVKVKAALEKYKAAALLAVDVSRSAAILAGTTNAVDANTIALLYQQEAAKALSDLLGLIQSFGIKF